MTKIYAEAELNYSRDHRSLFLVLKSVFEYHVTVALVIEDAGDPFRVVDEGIAVALKSPDDIVAA